MVEVATGTPGTKALISDYPYEEGIVAGTTRQKDIEEQYLQEDEPEDWD